MINLQLQPGVTPYNKPVAGNNQKPGALLGRKTSDKLSFSSSFIDRQLALKFKIIGDEHARNEEHNTAVFYYKKAINTNPDYVQPYYNLAKVYKKRGQMAQAIDIYQKLLKVKSDEIEAQSLLGQCFTEQGNYKAAKIAYEKAVKIDPKYDFASRSLKKLENLMLAATNPIKAGEIKQQIAKNNLKKALQLVNQHASPNLTKGLEDLDITFDETDSLAGHKNIAQYENHNKKIVITSDYIWSAPEITAAYIIHEAVHAKDKDGLTSVREEQDAYQASIEFWIAHNNGVKDPELDYAAGLYRENPDKLREKVGQTYRSRDKSIPEYSPYHIPPEQQGFFSRLKMYFFSVKDNYSSSTMPIN